MDLAVIKDFLPAQVALSATIILGIVVFSRLFLMWIPLLPWSGYWLRSFDLPRHFMFFNSYMELLIVFYLFVRWLGCKKDSVSQWLAVLAILALPSLVFAASQEYFLLSLFLWFLILGGPGVYQFFLDNMTRARSARIIEITVIMWLGLGIFIKFWNLEVGLEEGSLLAQRGGSIWGSNHVGGILLLLLPLVRNRKLNTATIGFLLLQFSKGIYIGLIIYAVVWFVLISRRQVLSAVLGVPLIITAVLVLYPPGGPEEFHDFVFSRFRLAGTPIESAKDVADRMLEGVQTDHRVDFVGNSVDMASESGYMGIGLGGFRWGLDNRDVPEGFLVSSAHNVFLNSLAEAGVVFLIGLVTLLVYFLGLALRVSKHAFVGILVWISYGLINGKIYATGGLATAGDYYTLLFVFAYVSHAYRQVQAKREEILQPVAGPASRPVAVSQVG